MIVHWIDDTRKVQMFKMELVFTNLLASHNVSAGRTRNMAPSVIVKQSLKLVVHSSAPIEIGKRTAVVHRDHVELIA